MSYNATDWVEERLGKYKGMSLFNSVGLLLEKVKENQDIDLGEIGTSRIITHVHDQKELDTLRANCLIRSKWLDSDRYVTNRQNEILVTDIIKTKLRFIAKEETTNNRYFNAFRDSLVSCAKNISILFYLDSKLKTTQFLDEEIQKGPSIEQMTDKDALAMEESLNGPNFFSYLSLKLYRYNENKLQENKLTPEGAYQMAVSISNLGYLSGDDHVPEYIDEAIKFIDLAINRSKDASGAKYYSFKIKYLLLQKKLTESIAVFGEMYKVAPKSVYTYRSGLRIAKQQNKIAEAEQWAQHFKIASISEREKQEYNSVMYDFYVDQNKIKEAIPFADYLANNMKNSAWAWHNLAILYQKLKDYDKVIEIEKKALAISEFGAAKGTIAEAYKNKGINEFNTQLTARNPAAVSNSEKHLLEALKYDAYNYNILMTLSRVYISEFKYTNNRDYLSKGEGYLKRASQINANGKDLVEVAAEYAKHKAK